MRLSFLIALFPLTLAAQEGYPVSAGTGFFINDYGDILTNAHVVEGCDTVAIRGAVPPSEAEVVAADATIDLALIHSEQKPPRVASFRGYGDKIGAGDAVVLVGYPGQHSVTGEIKTVTSQVIAAEGPLGNPQWLQFEDAARHGNSGGPLLDESGNVVGVITGKSTLSRTNEETGVEEIIAESDIAITTDYVKQFLNSLKVNYWMLYSGVMHPAGFIEESARDYIVNIHCRK